MNLKYIVYCFLYFGIVYSQCENYNIEECHDDPHCNWEDNLILQNCNSEEEEFACNNVDQCSWDTQTTYYSCSNFGSSEACAEYSDYGCSWEWSWGGWGNHGSDCVGGGFQIDNSTCSGGNYFVDEGNCIEVLPPDCSEMNETECSSDNVCEWVEDTELVSCNDINSQQQCNAVGCSWYNGNYYACSICCWGEYEVNNSYCEETEYQLGDLNQDIVINIQDVIIVINLILNGEFDLAADLNLDNTINVLDVIQIVNIILNN